MKHPKTIEEISAPWLTEVLRGADVLRQSAVLAVDVRAVGHGVGFLSNRARVTLTYDRAEEGAPATVVIKMPAIVKEGADFAESTHVYEREIRFYREVAPHTPIRVPRMYAAIMDPAKDVHPDPGRPESVDGRGPGSGHEPGSGPGLREHHRAAARRLVERRPAPGLAVGADR
jgi:hypothetical protein